MVFSFSLQFFDINYVQLHSCQVLKNLQTHLLEDEKRLHGHDHLSK